MDIKQATVLGLKARSNITEVSELGQQIMTTVSKAQNTITRILQFRVRVKEKILAKMKTSNTIMSLQ